MSDQPAPQESSPDVPGFAELVYRETERINTRKDGGDKLVTTYSPLEPEATVEERRRLAMTANTARTTSNTAFAGGAVLVFVYAVVMSHVSGFAPLATAALLVLLWGAGTLFARHRYDQIEAQLDRFDEAHPLIRASERAFGACTVFQRHADALATLDPPSGVLEQVDETRKAMALLLKVASGNDPGRTCTPEEAEDEMVRHAAETAALRALAERRHQLIDGRSPAELLALTKTRSLSGAADAIVEDQQWLSGLLDGTSAPKELG